MVAFEIYTTLAGSEGRMRRGVLQGLMYGNAWQFLAVVEERDIRVCIKVGGAKDVGDVAIDAKVGRTGIE